jgi:methyltransferase (TIGR00027 family)
MSGPESTAARVALWRALHVEVDAAPHVFEDVVGLRLVAPDEGWRARGDMHPQGTAPFRASIVGRARYVEDFLEAAVAKGITQYVILGAGIDTFVQRRPELASKMRVFEIEQPAPQAWKKQRLAELNLPAPIFVPVDFEAGASWFGLLTQAGFDPKSPAVVAQTGVSMYLTNEANAATLHQMTALAPGSTFLSTFMLPSALLPEAERASMEFAARGAKTSGTPFISFYAPDEMLALARANGVPNAKVVLAPEMIERYFSNRSDGLRPASAEPMLVVSI